MSDDTGFLTEDDLALLRRLVDAREKRDEADRAKAEAEKEFREIEAEVHEKLDGGPLSRLPNVDLGEPYGKVTFHAKETTYGKITDKDLAQEYFENRAIADEMTEVKVVGQRLNEIVREIDENNGSMPPGITFTKRRYVQITRQK